MSGAAGTAKDIGVGLIGSLGGNKVADAVGGGQASHIVGGIAGGLGAGAAENKAEEKLDIVNAENGGAEATETEQWSVPPETASKSPHILNPHLRQQLTSRDAKAQYILELQSTLIPKSSCPQPNQESSTPVHYLASYTAYGALDCRSSTQYLDLLLSKSFTHLTFKFIFNSRRITYSRHQPVTP